MASTYTDIGTELMVTGENAGNWGTKTNTNIQILEEAVRGYVAQSIAGSAATTALTYTDGSTGDAARNMVIALTGSITGNQVVTVTAKEKMWIVDNQTSGAYTVQFMVSGQTGVTWATTDKGTKILYCNGTDVIDTDIGGVGSYDLNGEELILDADADTSITADTDDQIDIKIAGTDQLTIKDGALSPVTTNDIDLGTASLEFKDAYFDGTVTSDAFAGPLTGNVTGNASGTAATVTTAAQSNITSLGTLTTLTVDNVITDGATIGHTSDTDLITLADGIVTVAGEISVTTLDIGGTNVTSDATELNLLDGKAATNLALLGKTEGTNFTDSLLVGHATTGTLSSAEDNTGVGIGALDAITSADSVTAIGNDAATSVTSGGYATVVGAGAYFTNSTGTNNTAIGRFSLRASTGSDNVALGKDSGEALSSGNQNILIGSNTGDQYPTTGSGNVLIGNNIDADATGSARTLKIAGYDGSTTTTWIQGDSSGNLTFKRVDTGDDNPYVLTLQTGETDIAASDVLGSINFQAPDEGTGTDAILVAAGIDAVSEGDFSSSNNATKLSFKTAASEAAAEKMSLSSAGVLTVSGAITSSGIVTGTGFTAGSAVLAESELELLDGLTAGTAIASKVVTTDASIDTTGQRNLTISGELDAATLDISSSIDIAGASQFSGAVTVGVDDTGLDVKFFGATSGAYMLWDESTDDLVLAGAANLYLYDAGGGESLSSDGTDLTINAGADINLTATTDINVPANVGMTFGDDGEKIEGNGTNLTISSSGHTYMNMDGGSIYLTKSGTQFGYIQNASDDLSIKSQISDQDMLFKGNDGGSTITALTLDMSAAGAATFNDKVIAAGGQLTTTGKALVMGF